MKKNIFIVLHLLTFVISFPIKATPNSSKFDFKTFDLNFKTTAVVALAATVLIGSKIVYDSHLAYQEKQKEEQTNRMIKQMRDEFEQHKRKEFLNTKTRESLTIQSIWRMHKGKKALSALKKEKQKELDKLEKIKIEALQQKSAIQIQAQYRKHFAQSCFTHRKNFLASKPDEITTIQSLARKYNTRKKYGPILDQNIANKKIALQEQESYREQEPALIQTREKQREIDTNTEIVKNLADQITNSYEENKKIAIEDAKTELLKNSFNLEKIQEIIQDTQNTMFNDNQIVYQKNSDDGSFEVMKAHEDLLPEENKIHFAHKIKKDIKQNITTTLAALTEWARLRHIILYNQQIENIKTILPDVLPAEEKELQLAADIYKKIKDLSIVYNNGVMSDKENFSDEDVEQMVKHLHGYETLRDSIKKALKDLIKTYTPAPDSIIDDYKEYHNTTLTDFVSGKIQKIPFFNYLTNEEIKKLALAKEKYKQDQEILIVNNSQDTDAIQDYAQDAAESTEFDESSDIEVAEKKNNNLDDAKNEDEQNINL